MLNSACIFATKRSCSFYLPAVFWIIVSGVFFVDMSVTKTLRMVHRCITRCRKERRNKCSRNSHFHYAILPQIRFKNNDAGG